MKLFSSLSEQSLSGNNLLTVIPVLSPEWIISLNFRIHSTIPNTGIVACNIVHMTDGLNHAEYGSRAPFIGIVQDTYKLHIEKGVNGGNRYVANIPSVLSINQKYHLEVYQRYTSNGDYQYFVKLDGTEVFSILNSDARQFYDVKVYVSNAWNPRCPVYISNFKISNFL